MFEHELLGICVIIIVRCMFYFITFAVIVVGLANGSIRRALLFVTQEVSHTRGNISLPDGYVRRLELKPFGDSIHLIMV